MGSKAMKVKTAKQASLLDFVVTQEKGDKEVHATSVPKDQKSFEEVLQEAEDLFKQHRRCFTKSELATLLKVSVHKVIEILNMLVKIGVVKKRLNDEGELVYCPAT